MLRIVVVWVMMLSILSMWGQKAQACSCELPPERLEKSTYILHYIHVPALSGFRVMPVVSPELALVPNMIPKKQGEVFAAINAGFFDPANKQTTSYVTINGKTVADPTLNRRFMDNPDLAPYLPQMLNRSEFRVLSCNGQTAYQISGHDTPVTSGCDLRHRLQAGPNLFDPSAMESEAFVAYQNQQRIRDPLGVDRKNARSAIGIDANGGVIIAMVAMKPLKNKPSGVTLVEMAQIMKDLGAKDALSLDGGSSSTFWTPKGTIYGKLDSNLKPVKRPVKSALVVIRED